ncbi:MAG: penicillin-binding protein 2 [Acidimicrobiia bacterium]|nr:penicillin-binding protein 2 [Acidimicrobiia bacterium]
MSTGARLAVLGVLFLALFSVLTLRLWTVQVTASTEYQILAENNQVRVVETPAPRGEIRDRQGRLMAGTQPALAAVLDGALVPDEDDPDEPDFIQRLSALTGIAADEVRHAVADARTRADRITLVEELSDEQALRLVEYEEDFPGVSVLPQPVRIYPEAVLGGHLVGYIGDPNEDDIAKPGISPTDRVGRAGVERQYDDDLRGTPGIIKYRIDAQQNVLEVVGEQPPEAGDNLILTVDLDVQRILEDSLMKGLRAARDDYQADCDPATDPRCPVRAVGVVLDATDGAVVAMSSVPGYDPNLFVDGVSQREWDRLSELAVFNNFAIQGEYAPASTFKSVAYVLALEERIYALEGEAQVNDATYFCDGQLEFRFTDGSPQVLNDWTSTGHGDVDLHTGLQTSCDLYFWQIALNIWTNRSSTEGGTIAEDLLQQWARRFGFDEPTGVDLPFEQGGLIPDREWFERAQVESPGLVRDGPWTGGDVLNAVIGQGSVLVTPLQLANAYAAMVNGGTLWQPRVVDAVVDEAGEVVRQIAPEAIGHIDLSPQSVAFLRQDLHQVINGPTGTARSAFADFGEGVDLVGGKTGTAEVIKGETAEEDVDTAVFTGVVPIDDPRYVVVIVIERGGSGGQIAAPTAIPVLQYLLTGTTTGSEIEVGSGETD